jgi:hypothetical protein
MTKKMSSAIYGHSPIELMTSGRTLLQSSQASKEKQRGGIVD